MSYVLSIPAQVYFLIAFAAGAALLADTAVRSWRSPERVTDPSYMWPRPAPARGELLYGPRLPSGAFRMSPVVAVARRAAALNHPAPVVVVPPASAPFWSQVGGGDRYPALDTAALRDSYRLLADDRVHAMINGEWPRPLSVDPVHVGATEDWSPLDEHEAATAARLPLDDIDEWLAERIRRFEHELSRIDCRTVSLVKGETQRTVDDELDAFIDGSQQLHAYRLLRIGGTGEYPMVGRAQVPVLQGVA